MGPMLINGIRGEQISIYDRGLLYGDGVFRTMRIADRRVLHWPRHYDKLQQDCAALSIACPPTAVLSGELQQLSQHQPSGIAKIIISRGIQPNRGYAPAPDSNPTRILSLTSAPVYPSDFFSAGIKLRVCDLRLSHQPKLAGIKHLNRLENVLAAAEFSDSDVTEGLLLDSAENVIEGTRSNVFIVRDGGLVTPDLSRCGVAGVQRARVMEWARQHNVHCVIRPFGLAELFDADEIFLVNSVIGLWPVRELQNRSWNRHPLSIQVQSWLNHAPD